MSKEKKNIVKLFQLSKNYKQDIVGGPFGSNLKATEYVAKGQPIIRLQNVDRFNFLIKNIQFVTSEKAKELSSHSFKRGDIVVTKLGSPLGKCCVVPDTNEFKEGVISSDIVRIRIDEKKVDKRYLVYHINSNIVANQLNGSTQGSTRPRVTLQDIRNLDLIVPSLPEQQRIVQKLDALFARIDKAAQLAEENLEHLKHLLPAALNEVFEEVYEQFCKKPLSSFDKIVAGGTPSRSVKEYWNGTISWFTSGELNHTYISSSKECISEEGLNNSNAKLFPKGTLLVGMYDTAAFKMSILEIDAACNQAIVGIKPDEKILKVEFLKYQLEYLKPEILQQRQGVRQQNLNAQKIKNVNICLPDLPTQQKIVTYLNQLSAHQQNLQQHYTKKLQQLKALKASLLDAAFRGELSSEADVVEMSLSKVAEEEGKYGK